MDMIAALRDTLQERGKTEDAMSIFLSFDYVVYDFERLSIYTGSRISEYGQNKKPKGKSFAIVPVSPDSGVWGGSPLAFIDADFVFYDTSLICLPNSACLSQNANTVIMSVHIRFRFDKSKTNFSIRKYMRIPGAMFDPVVASVNIIRRARALSIPLNEPLAQYRNKKGTRSCLHDYHVRDVMRAACVRAYPNPEHYCRKNIKGIVAHSNRITAALCLMLGGSSIPEIAFRLRWEEGSVPTYLRECFVGVGILMRKAIAGAILST